MASECQRSLSASNCSSLRGCALRLEYALAVFDIDMTHRRVKEDILTHQSGIISASFVVQPKKQLEISC
jgi:hypothetical protein